MPGYERWAKHSREWVEEKRTSRPTDQLRALDAGSEIHLSPTDLASPLPTQVELE